jgi:hypothetical protein
MWNFRVDYTNYVPGTSRGHYSQAFTFSGGGADPAIGDAHIVLSSAAMTFSSLDFWGATNDSICASFSNSILSNTKWISVWHDPMFAHVQKVYDGGILTTSVWSRALSTGGSAVLMVNETNTQPMSVQFSALGMSPALTTFDVFDCWSNQDLGNFNGGFTNSIPMQDCGLYVVTPVSTGGGGGSSALTNNDVRAITLQSNLTVAGTVTANLFSNSAGTYAIGDGGGNSIIGDDATNSDFTTFNSQYGFWFMGDLFASHVFADGSGLTNTPLALGTIATGSNGASAVWMVGLDAAGKATTNAVPSGGGSTPNVLTTNAATMQVVSGPVTLTNTANTFSGNGGGLTNIYVSSLVISTNAAPQTNTIVGFFWLTNGVNVYKIPVLQ